MNRARRRHGPADGPISAKLREQAEDARIVAQLHAGTNGGHILELGAEGMLGFLRVHRSHFDDVRRALDVAEARCEDLDDKPDPIFARPPERLVF